MAENPVTKVVHLLKEIEKELKVDAEKDEDAFTKMQCWCKKTISETETGITKSEECMNTEQGSIENNTGKNANNKAEADGLEKDIEQDQNDLADAIKAREKGRADFVQTQRELEAAISSLKGAITVLKKHQGGAFLQTGKNPASLITSDMATDLKKHALSLFTTRHESELTPTQKNKVESFLSAPSFGAYSSQSGEIFGILESMLDTMVSDLKSAQADEAKDTETFQKTKALLEDRILANGGALDEKNGAAAEAAAKKAASQEKLAKCTAQNEQLTAFLQETKTSCDDNKTEYNSRSTARNDELGAIGQAITVLDSPEAFAKFQKAFAFAQVNSVTQKSMNSSVTNARRALTSLSKSHKALSQKTKKQVVNPVMQLIQEAVKAKTGAKVDFTQIIAKIEDLVKELKSEVNQNIKDRDACVKDINDRELNLQDLDNTISKLTSKGEQLQADLDQTIAELDEAQTTKKETMESVAEAGANRAIDNADFVKAHSEATQAVQVLDTAKAVLAPVFGESLLELSRHTLGLLQEQKPQGFADYQVSGGAKVMKMIDTIIEDTKKNMAVLQTEENAAQAAYEKFHKNANDALDALNSEITTLTHQKGDLEAEKAQNEVDLADTQHERDDSHTAYEAKKSSCKFLMDNFEIMQKAKKEEVAALNEAKAFLNGMQ